jgi:multicomponent Na+:H+ antiporter subunit F
MTDALIVAALVILASLLAGLVRVVRGPSLGDRMLAAQLFGTGAVALLVILSQAMAMPALIDVALVFAILAAVAVVAFVRSAEGGDDDPA